MLSYPKTRVDALCDGIFAFAMTLLVVDIRLPDSLPLASSAELLAHLSGLASEAVAYLVSFFVLAAHWRGTISFRHRGEEMSGRVLALWLWFLLFVTLVPFSSSVVGHYGHLPAATWIYGANMVALGLLALPLHGLEVEQAHVPAARASRRRSMLFIASALLSVAISLLHPGWAMYAYFLNALGGLPTFREATP